MSESGKNFGQLNSEFGHNFESLSERLGSAYQQLHLLAHADSSPHTEREELLMSVLLDGEIREVFCTIDEYDWMRVRPRTVRAIKGTGTDAALRLSVSILVVNTAPESILPAKKHRNEAACRKSIR